MPYNNKRWSGASLTIDQSVLYSSGGLTVNKWGCHETTSWLDRTRNGSCLLLKTEQLSGASILDKSNAPVMAVTKHLVQCLWTEHAAKMVQTALFLNLTGSTIRHLCQNEWETGSWDRTSKNAKHKCRTTTIVAVCAARYTAIVLPRHFCFLRLESCPSKQSQAPLRYWCGPSSPLVLVMANSWIYQQKNYLLTIRCRRRRRLPVRRPPPRRPSPPVQTAPVWTETRPAARTSASRRRGNQRRTWSGRRKRQRWTRQHTARKGKEMYTPLDGGGGGGGWVQSRVAKRSGMLVVPLRGRNLLLWCRLGC